MCGVAADYEKSRSLEASKYGTDLIKILLAFNALEQTVSTIDIVVKKNVGIGRAVGSILDAAFSGSLPAHCLCNLDRLECAISRTSLFSDTEYGKYFNGSSPSFVVGMCATVAVRDEPTHEWFESPIHDVTDSRKSGEAIIFRLRAGLPSVQFNIWQVTM